MKVKVKDIRVCHGQVGLGDLVKDSVTGFIGICSNISLWPWGCITIGVLPQKRKETGAPSETSWFDEARVQLVRKSKVEIRGDVEIVVADALPAKRAPEPSPGGPDRRQSPATR